MEQIVVPTEKPDLIVYSGDLIASEDVQHGCETMRRAIHSAVKAEIPFAVIYGNHDSEKGVTEELNCKSCPVRI